MIFEMEIVVGRELVFHEGRFYLVDTRDTLDAGWETGVIEIDMDSMLEAGYSLKVWEEIVQDCLEYTDNSDWIIVNYPNKKDAIKGHNKIVKDIQKNGTEYALDWVL